MSAISYSDLLAPAAAARRRPALNFVLTLLPLALFAYAAWLFYFHLTFWFDAPLVARSFSRIFGEPVAEPGLATSALAFAMNFGLCPLVAVVCHSVWRLIARYRLGDFHSAAAVSALRRATRFALIANIYWNVAHALTLVMFATWALAPWSSLDWRSLVTLDDVLKFTLILSLYGLAEVQRVGAEIAEEYDQIV